MWCFLKLHLLILQTIAVLACCRAKIKQQRRLLYPLANQTHCVNQLFNGILFKSFFYVLPGFMGRGKFLDTSLAILVSVPPISMFELMDSFMFSFGTVVGFVTIPASIVLTHSFYIIHHIAYVEEGQICKGDCKGGSLQSRRQEAEVGIRKKKSYPRTCRDAATLLSRSQRPENHSFHVF